MKKLCSLLLILCLIFSLSACGGNETATDNDTGSSTTQNQTDVTDTSSTEQNTDTPSSTTSKPTTTTKPETSKPTTTTKPNTPTHTHSYSGATCTAPAKCSCGATNGSALGHSYNNADCTNPKKCSRCGATNGSALGHSYSNATCTSPKKCSRCGATSGSALGHTEVIDEEIPPTCKEGGLTKGSHCSVCNVVLEERWRIGITSCKENSEGRCKFCNAPIDGYKFLLEYIKKKGTIIDYPYNGTGTDGYKLTYSSSGVTYNISYDIAEDRITFGSSNPNDHNYTCSVSCYKGKTTQNVSMRYANNGSNTPYGTINAPTFKSGGSLLSYAYDGFDSSRASYYKTVLADKVSATLSGVAVILKNTGTGVTLKSLGFRAF